MQKIKIHEIKPTQVVCIDQIIKQVPVKPIKSINLPKSINKDKKETEAGIFIHWGIYSIPAYSPRRKSVPKSGIYNGSEWYLERLRNTFLYGMSTVEYHQKHYGTSNDTRDQMINRYYQFLDEFELRAKTWNPKTWVDQIVKTGATYVIFTAKHHDGVSLYPSKYGMYHTKRDYVEELKQACLVAGLKFGIYYSLMEWTPLYSKGKKKIQKYVTHVLQPQLLEIVARYQPDILWADGDWHHTVETWGSDKFLEGIINNTVIITNDRWGNNFDEYIQSLPANKKQQYQGRYYKTGQDRLLTGTGNWEHVNTIGNSWGYAKNQIAQDYKTPQAIMNLYHEIHSKGGRFTLNIGPKATGELDPKEQEVLGKIKFT